MNDSLRCGTEVHAEAIEQVLHPMWHPKPLTGDTAMFLAVLSWQDRVPRDSRHSSGAASRVARWPPVLREIRGEEMFWLSSCNIFTGMGTHVASTMSCTFEVLAFSDRNVDH